MASPSSPGEEPQGQNQQQEVVVAVKESEREKECLHKTKTIHFLGRTTPIVLQNDNGPCPLLAICNVLLLKNNLNLSADCTEVSQEKLLSLVAERLIDSNSNVNNKDAGYVENQQQNIADAIEMLPRLATGIDVNLKFRRIDDFEFTRECAIFDLLDIPLYHGWMVDPQDYDTANAIGPKSYNTLMGELVALEIRNMEDESKNLSGEDGKTKAEEDCIDFVAATTATLGVPSPCLSKARSFDDSPHSVSDHQNVRKGDIEEEAELLRVLKLSETELPSSVDDSLVANVDGRVVSIGSYESKPMKGTMVVASRDTSEGHVSVDKDLSALSTDDDNNPTSSETLPGELTGSSLKTDLTDHFDKSVCTESGEHISCNDVIENHSADTVVETQDALFLFWAKSTGSLDGDPTGILHDGQKVENKSTSINEVHKLADISSGHDLLEVPGLASLVPESDSSSSRLQNIDTPDTFTSSVDGSEPIYEGEECILDSRTSNCEEREPMYEGEVILSEQADETVRSIDEITALQGERIRNFLKNNASQLTFYGLFCLQDGLKERELCVFFRNNHFSTMFKYDGELYLLATDQGYINQPDLVWEKLNEVNGDTLFMTGNFKEFKVESHTNDPWDEHNAVTSTADYFASIGSDAQAGVDINSDLQLAIALQQQEYEQQQEQQPQHHNVQQASATGGSRLFSGSQVPRSSGKTASSSSSKIETKSKDKCNVM
ncbi:hypothetical protein SADUNF_Sadunf03G0087800 [Salix dunnii]|uniref:MINDY deubiquitinase domain-containing protein n=1 Tax=Salix dunnii TaxID=1413687 RepID=A0A835N497_9ROSI|nr:hypothetical protein SADUNF_Sadunf03G0087800 [Salix dunnii]